MVVPKIKCEVCGETDESVLDRHHIIERGDPNCTNHDYNIAVLCASCHRLVHAKRIEIIGPYPATTPTGRILVFKKDGVPNVPGIEKPYYVPKPAAMRLRNVEEK
jgi:hypothetical protein